MKHKIISALFCGAVLTALPAFAAGIGVGGTAGGGIGAGPVTGAAGTSVGTGVNTTGQVTSPAGAANAYSAADINAALGMPDTTTCTTTAANGASRSTGGLSTSGEINNATAGNNAGSVDTTVQTPSSRMRHQAQANANAAMEEQTTRQLNQQQTQTKLNASGSGAIH